MPDGNAYTPDAPEIDLPMTGVSHAQKPAEISKSGWGGPRANSGGRRPGAGRPRKRPEPAPDIAAWRVLATRPQAERLAVQELTRVGYEVYLPLIAIRRRDPVMASMWHEVRVPLFPGYGFIRLTQRESREPVITPRGVRELLHRPDGRLLGVPDAEIERLRAGDEERLRLPREHAPLLPPGSVVRLLAGPFQGHSATVRECDGVRTQVEVMVFGRATPMWVDRVGVVL